MRRQSGQYRSQMLGGEEVRAFIPYPLPPTHPPLQQDSKLIITLRRAEQDLARLEGAQELLPSLAWFIYAFVRKEAVLSSQIEGTQATLHDLFEFETTETFSKEDIDDVEEVCNYLAALLYARNQLHSPKGLPLSIRLLNETHRHLLKGGRGAQKSPGEIRTSQNWIGGTRPGNAMFVPPPPHEVRNLLGDLENYIYQPDDLHPLLRIGLLHVQLETIHPYLDGNGRIGRLFISLLLEHFHLLSSPLLYLSLHFKKHREEYFRLLMNVRTNGDWEEWLLFFLEGISLVAQESHATIRKLSALISQHRQSILSKPQISVMAVRIFEYLPTHPIITITRCARDLQTSVPTVTRAIRLLEKFGILKEATGKRRGRVFGYQKYLDYLSTDTNL